MRLDRVFHILYIKARQTSKRGVFSLIIYLYFGERGIAATSEVSGVLSRQDKRIIIMAEVIVLIQDHHLHCFLRVSLGG